MSYIEQTLMDLQHGLGVHYLLAFLLVFTIVFAILTKTKILGDRKNFNVAVALVIGLLLIMEPGKLLVTILQEAVPVVSVILVAILMFMLMIGLLGGKVELMGGSISGWIALASAAAVTYIFGYSAGWWGQGRTVSWLSWLNNPQTTSTVIVLLVFGIVVWFVTKDDVKKPQEEKFLNKLGDLVKGK